MDEAMRKALMAFLKENLTVSLDIDTNWDAFDSNSKRASVKLFLDGEEIASDACSFDVGGN